MKKLILLFTFLLTSLVAISQIPTPNPANNTFHCINDVQVYGDQNIDPLATYSFSISPVFPFTVISSGDQIEVTWTTPGVYTIDITKTVGSCSSTGQAVINVYPPSTPIITSGTLCQGNGTLSLTSTIPGSNPVFSGNGVNGSTFDANGLLPGIYNINFTSTDINGCIMNATSTVTITPPPSVPIIFTN